MALPAKGDVASDALLAAASSSDAEKLVLALAEAPPDARTAKGKTALMLAARAVSFECAKRLIWAGADPRPTDDSGKKALDLLDPASPAYGPLSLLIRCHGFCRDNGGPGGNQRYTQPTPMHDRRREWINKRWDEGYRITSIAGDDSPESEDDG